MMLSLGLSLISTYILLVAVPSSLVEGFCPLPITKQRNNIIPNVDFTFKKSLIISTLAKKTDKEAVEDKEQQKGDGEPYLRRVSPDEEGVPIPFVDLEGQSFIECYPDSIASVDGVDYTIGVPCDYSVALCRFDANEQLLPVELDDPLMDNIFPIAEGIVEEEFGDELVLQRTPQTLTLVGELEEDDEDDDDYDDDDDDGDYDELMGGSGDDMSGVDDDEEVEVLLSFDYKGTEYNLVRLLDPILLVGKHSTQEDQSQNRILLTPKESDEVMPILERMFLEHVDGDQMLP